MTYIGIDPGKSGAMAVLYEDGDVYVATFDEGTYVRAITALQWEGCRCCLERVGARPGQGVTSMFNFGTNFGFIQGVLRACNIPYELVTPQKWKREFGVTGDKNSSIDVARRLFPDVSLLRTDKCRKDDNNIAEALLMAEYARRHL